MCRITQRLSNCLRIRRIRAIHALCFRAQLRGFALTEATVCIQSRFCETFPRRFKYIVPQRHYDGKCNGKNGLQR